MEYITSLRGFLLFWFFIANMKHVVGRKGGGDGGVGFVWISSAMRGF
jgi:hypothetical protein